jgi:hypothetical protein
MKKDNEKFDRFKYTSDCKYGPWELTSEVGPKRYCRATLPEQYPDLVDVLPLRKEEPSFDQYRNLCIELLDALERWTAEWMREDLKKKARTLLYPETVD